MAEVIDLRESIKRHLEANFPQLAGAGEDGQPMGAPTPTPFVWRDPTTLPTRQFVYGRHYIRKFVSATVAPGGVGKSSLAMAELLDMVSGKPLLGIKPKRPMNVWYWNGEDPLEELERRLHATAIRYGLQASDLEGRLWLDSGRDSPIRIAEETPDGCMIVRIVMDEMEQHIKANAFDAVVIDPFVSSHAVSENDNVSINAVIKALAAMSNRCDCAVELDHHVRKAREGSEVQAEDARGASALIDGCRSVRTLSRMDKDVAGQYGINDRDRRSHFYVQLGKANLGPPVDPDWHKLVGVGLGNQTPEDFEDEVGVVERWFPPSLFEGVDLRDVFRVQTAIAAGRYRADPRSPDYVGIVAARVLGLDASDKGEMRKVARMLSEWLKSGLLVEAEEMDEQRKLKRFVVVGRMTEAA